MYRFRTAGDYGDVIYALACVKAMGGGEVLYEATRYTREPMTAARWAALDPLLTRQEYVKRTGPFRGESCVNLNDFRARAFPAKWLPVGRSILEWMCLTHGVDFSVAASPWIDVPPVRVASVIINRTPRYHNLRFPWAKVLEKYPNCAFIGLPSEYHDFVLQYGPVRFAPQPNLFCAAQTIAGADLFIGNQSACYAIAEAMKKPAVLEVYPSMPNCLFSRPDVWHGWDGSLELPEVQHTHV